MAVLCAALLATGGCGELDESARVPRAPGWRAPNADLANTRWVGGEIDSNSVSRLEVAWRLPVSGYAATPLVLDGVAYVQDLGSNVFAVDVESGEVRWKKTYDEPSIGPNGVAVAEGRVYGATSTRAFALDAETGREVWSRTIVEIPSVEGIDMAPGVKDETVYVSTVPVTPTQAYGPGARGILWALDAETGARRWTWATVPADLWGDREMNSGGGLWHPPAFDDDGAMYVAVANPAPFPGPEEAPWGASRPGPNKWTNSLVKLDAATGTLVWGRQVLPHDIYDWDLQCPPILMRVGGRRLVIAGGKMGFVFAYDRATGERLWKTPVGEHNGHDDDNRVAMRGELEGYAESTDILPGVFGGIETQMAADADTVYVPVVNLSTAILGNQMRSNQSFDDGTGELVAIDVATGDVRWTRALPTPAFGAASVVNDLVFTTTYEGRLWALSVHTGRVVWSERLPSSTTSTVAIAGDTLLTASTGGIPEGTTKVIAYRLD